MLARLGPAGEPPVLQHTGSFSGCGLLWRDGGLDGVVLVAAAIGSLGLGIVGEVLFIVSMSASYARRDAIMPLQAMACARRSHLPSMAVALGVVDGTLVIWTLGVSASIANFVGAMILHGKLKAVMSPPGGSWFRGLLGHFAASCAAAGLSILVADWLSGPGQSSYQKIGVALAASLAGGTLYLDLATVARLGRAPPATVRHGARPCPRCLGGRRASRVQLSGTRAGKTFK